VTAPEIVHNCGNNQERLDGHEQILVTCSCRRSFRSGATQRHDTSALSRSPNKNNATKKRTPTEISSNSAPRTNKYGGCQGKTAGLVRNSTGWFY